MKVLHVCASDVIGGAARAAFRLHRSFRHLNTIDSTMLVRGRASDDSNVIVYTPKPLSWKYHYNFSIKRRFLDIYWSSFVTLNKVMHSRADIWTGMISELNGLPCDLVHLHWLGMNTLSIEEISQINKPVVWTLHDMWTFCGAEHYVDDEPNARFRKGYFPDNRTEGESGPDMNRSVWGRKKDSWKKPMTLVGPSRWMADCAKSSLLCNQWPVHRIPNPLDLDLWKPFTKEQARRLLNLPVDKKIVLFGAIGGGRDLRKGADLLREALNVYKQNDGNVHLAIFGESEPVSKEPFAFPVTYLGRFQDDISLIAAYNSADIMLVPSRQDNLPQTAVEAQACGIPVVAFDVGGLSDIVSHKETGYLAQPYDTKDFALGVEYLLDDQHRYAEIAYAARKSAKENFAEPVVATAYAELYEKVLSQQG